MIILKSILSGVILSIASRCYIITDNKVIGAFLFSLGLLCILQFKWKLFTGAIKEVNKSNISTMLEILLGNFIGSQFFLLFHMNTSEIIKNKLSNSVLDLFIYSVCCGILMAIATMTKNRLITIMCVACFIICGFEHSIANMCFFAGNISFEIIKFFIINILGNSIGAVSVYRLNERCNK